MRKARYALLVAALVCCSLACNLLTPIIFIGEHKKQIYPEFDKLPNKTAAVMVWTDPGTLFDYPHARLELATYLSDKLSYEMEQRELGTYVVDARDVEDYLQKELDARIDPQLVGRNFQTDYVIYVEILEFQVRDPEVPQFLQGRLEASVTVFDTRDDAGMMTKYELTPVTTMYPGSGPVVMTSTNSPIVREGLYRMFAEEVARKFYEHTVDL